MKKFNDSRFLPRKTLTSLLPDLYFVVNRILLPWYMFHSWTFNFKEFSMCTGSAPTASEHSSLNCTEDHFPGYGPWVYFYFFLILVYIIYWVFLSLWHNFLQRKNCFSCQVRNIVLKVVSYLIMTYDQWVHIIRNDNWHFLAETRASLLGNLLKNPMQFRRPQFDFWFGRMLWRRNRPLTPVFFRLPWWFR